MALNEFLENTKAKIFVGIGLDQYVNMQNTNEQNIDRQNNKQNMNKQNVNGQNAIRRNDKNNSNKEENSVVRVNIRRIIFSVLIISSLVFILSIHFRNELEITFMDVSQGDGILIRTVSGTSFLIDGGSSDVNQVGIYRIAPFLKASGISDIKGIFITHMDSDHISGIKEILNPANKLGIRVENLILPDICDKETAFEEIIALAKLSDVTVMYMKSGDIYTEDEVSLNCLHPTANYEYESSNEYSLVLSLQFKNFDMLFTGDIEEDGEDALIDTITHTYEVLKVAHHGSKNSTQDLLLEKTDPDIAIISCGKNNRYGHPHKELLERLKDYAIITYNTSICGAITIKTDGEKFNVSTYLKNAGKE